MYGIYANIWGILMVIVSIYTIHGSYGHGVTKAIPQNDRFMARVGPWGPPGNMCGRQDSIVPKEGKNMKEHKATIGNPIMPKHQTNVLET
jgi:hypothetical protein